MPKIQLKNSISNQNQAIACILYAEDINDSVLFCMPVTQINIKLQKSKNSAKSTKTVINTQFWMNLLK